MIKINKNLSIKKLELLKKLKYVNILIKYKYQFFMKN